MYKPASRPIYSDKSDATAVVPARRGLNYLIVPKWVYNIISKPVQLSWKYNSHNQYSRNIREECEELTFKRFLFSCTSNSKSSIGRWICINIVIKCVKLNDSLTYRVGLPTIPQSTNLLHFATFRGHTIRGCQESVEFCLVPWQNSQWHFSTWLIMGWDVK